MWTTPLLRSTNAPKVVFGDSASMIASTGYLETSTRHGSGSLLVAVLLTVKVNVENLNSTLANLNNLRWVVNGSKKARNVNQANAAMSTNAPTQRWRKQPLSFMPNLELAQDVLTLWPYERLLKNNTARKNNVVAAAIHPITRASIRVPMNAPRSLTRRRSTRDAGRKPRRMSRISRP